MKKIISLLLFILVCYMPFQGLAQEKMKIACIGNSITEGSDNYPTPLSKMLGNKYEVGNFGK